MRAGSRILGAALQFLAAGFWALGRLSCLERFEEASYRQGVTAARQLGIAWFQAPDAGLSDFCMAAGPGSLPSASFGRQRHGACSGGAESDRLLSTQSGQGGASRVWWRLLHESASRRGLWRSLWE